MKKQEITNNGSMLKRLIVPALSVALYLGCVSSSHAISLSFNVPLANLLAGGGNEAILNYYNGGTDQFGSTGPNYGISFGSDALALVNYAVNTTGTDTGYEPGGGNALFFLSGNKDVMNVAAGFTTGFSFYYCAPGEGFLNVWSGVNDTGTLLASLTLPPTGLGSGVPYFSVWKPLGVSFSGTAESVDFGGVANEITFADVTLGSVNPIISNNVPDAGSTMALLGIGLAGLAAVRRKLS